MKRLVRILLTGLTALSLLLCIAVVVLAVPGGMVYYSPASGFGDVSLIVTLSRVELKHLDRPSDGPHLGWRLAVGGERRTRAFVRAWWPSMHVLYGGRTSALPWLSGFEMGAMAFSERELPFIGFDATPPPGPRTATCRFVSVPTWAVLAFTATPALLTAWRAARRRTRYARGRCAACGYDLRATPDRCPECGAVPERADSAKGRPA